MQGDRSDGSTHNLNTEKGSSYTTPYVALLPAHVMVMAYKQTVAIIMVVASTLVARVNVR